MIRILFWLVIGALLAAGLRKLVADGERRGAGGAPRRAEDMVRCCVCGLNLPQSEATPVRGDAAAPARWACGAPHARDAAAKAG
jgi:hypothetical protein